MDLLKTVDHKTRLAYNKAAHTYHALFHNELEEKPYDRNLLDSFSRLFRPGALLCDAGCGPSGHIGKFLCDRGMRIVGIDISDHCIKMAKSLNPGIEYQWGDMADTAFPDRHFDGIVSYYSIIHTPKILVPLFFNEFYRILKPDGYLLVVVKEGSEEGWLDELIGVKTEIYFSLFRVEEIRNYFLNSGFVIVYIEKRHPYPFEIQNDRIFALGVKETEYDEVSVDLMFSRGNKRRQ